MCVTICGRFCSIRAP
ncbi:MAG: hypothetical protein ACLTER_01545 [Ruminococcus sp.]